MEVGFARQNNLKTEIIIKSCREIIGGRGVLAEWIEQMEKMRRNEFESALAFGGKSEK